MEKELKSCTADLTVMQQGIGNSANQLISAKKGGMAMP
jgi:hypothetical protein